MAVVQVGPDQLVFARVLAVERDFANGSLVNDPIYAGGSDAFLVEKRVRGDKDALPWRQGV